MLKIFDDHRYLILLIFFLVYWTLSPFLEAALHLRIVGDIFFTIILLSAIHAAAKGYYHTLIAVVLAIPVLYGTWEKYVDPLPDTITFGPMFSVFFFCFVIFIFLQGIFRAPKVNLEVVSAAAVVYLFLGLLWGDFYFILEYFAPGSFAVPDGVETRDFHLFNYYSYVTLTTLGFGEITPLTRPARSLATLEALIGQLYLAVLIARLVSMYSGRSRGPDASPDDRD